MPYLITGDFSDYVIFCDEITGECCKLIPPPTDAEWEDILYDLHPANQGEQKYGKA